MKDKDKKVYNPYLPLPSNEAFLKRIRILVSFILYPITILVKKILLLVSRTTTTAAARSKDTTKKSSRIPKNRSNNENLNKSSKYSYSNNDEPKKKKEKKDDPWIIALDCEMVGCGKRGLDSLLARCSIVCLKIPQSILDNSTSTSTMSMIPKSKYNYIHLGGKKMIVLYDVIVKPTKNITDYRTPYSGITKQSYEEATTKPGWNRDNIPVVSFKTCQNDILSLLNNNTTSTDNVIMVGHGLDNDLEVLQMTYPIKYRRDTAYYPPFTYQDTTKPRKLKHLVKEYLNISIQEEEQHRIGHSSVEDAAAVLLLYDSHQFSWEETLCSSSNSTLTHPLALVPMSNKDTDMNYILYLDGANLPLHLKRKEESSTTTTTTSSEWQLISKTTPYGNHYKKIPHDWIPSLQHLLNTTHKNKDETNGFLSTIHIVYDGVKFQTKKKRHRLLVPSSSFSICKDMNVYITTLSENADDFIIQEIKRSTTTTNHTTPKPHEYPTSSSRVFISLPQVLPLLKTSHSNNLHILIRRNGSGSTQTHKTLFTKLNLRRPEEGVYCLTSLTPRLQKHSIHVVKEIMDCLKHTNTLLSFEVRRGGSLSDVIVTDDVFLGQRFVDNYGMVLNYRQLQQLI